MSENTGIIKVSSGLLSALSSRSIKIDVFAQEILALECIVAGTSFRDLGNVHNKLENEVKIELKREAKNKFDPFAVALMYEKHKIGYLPKTKNETIARLLDAGKNFFAKIRAKEWEGSWLRLEISVYLND